MIAVREVDRLTDTELDIQADGQPHSIGRKPTGKSRCQKSGVWREEETL